MMNELATYNPNSANMLTSGTGDFLPQIKLLHSTSKILRDLKGSKPGQFSIGDDVLLGDTFDCFLCGKRAHALYIKDTKKLLESYQPDEPTFQRIARIKVPKGSTTEFVMYGLEFLCYIYDLQKFCTFFFANNSTRPVGRTVNILYTSVEDRQKNTTEFPEITHKMPFSKSVNFRSEIRQFGKAFQAFVPVVTPAPARKDQDFPGVAVVEDAMQKFLGPITCGGRAIVTNGSDVSVTADDDR